VSYKGEAEEAQALLKVVQQKLGERESALAAAMQEQTSKHHLITDSQKRCDELTSELRRAESERDEQRQQASQLQQRVNVTMQQVSMLQTELQEKQSQLNSTHVRLKQVPNQNC